MTIFSFSVFFCVSLNPVHSGVFHISVRQKVQIGEISFFSAGTRHWNKAEDCVIFMKTILTVSDKDCEPFSVHIKHIRTFPTCSLWGPEDNDSVHIRVLCSSSPEEFLTIILDQNSLHQFLNDHCVF